MGTLKILSWNVNGLGDKIKRGIVSQYLKRLSPNIVLLQETHMMGNMYRALDRGGYKMVAHAGYSSGARGVGIMTHKSLPIVIHQIREDPGGRWVAMSATIRGTRFNIYSIYIPPRLHEQALLDIGAVLLQFPAGQTILGGDFNLVADNDMDRTSNVTHRPRGSPLLEFMDAMGLIDIWRHCNPKAKQFTYHS